MLWGKLGTEQSRTNPHNWFGQIKPSLLGVVRVFIVFELLMIKTRVWVNHIPNALVPPPKSFCYTVAIPSNYLVECLMHCFMSAVLQWLYNMECGMRDEVQRISLFSHMTDLSTHKKWVTGHLLYSRCSHTLRGKKNAKMCLVKVQKLVTGWFLARVHNCTLVVCIN